MVVFKLKKQYPHERNLEMPSLSLWNTPAVVRFSIPQKGFHTSGEGQSAQADGQTTNETQMHGFET